MGQTVQDPVGFGTFFFNNGGGPKSLRPGSDSSGAVEEHRGCGVVWLGAVVVGRFLQGCGRGGGGGRRGEELKCVREVSWPGLADLLGLSVKGVSELIPALSSMVTVVLSQRGQGRRWFCFVLWWDDLEFSFKHVELGFPLRHLRGDFFKGKLFQLQETK